MFRTFASWAFTVPGLYIIYTIVVGFLMFGQLFVHFSDDIIVNFLIFFGSGMGVFLLFFAGWAVRLVRPHSWFGQLLGDYPDRAIGLYRRSGW